MKIYSIKILALLFFGLLGNACNDYLDVQPEDKYLESQVYSSEVGINNVLNGIYLHLAKPTLYGGNLTMSTVELLAQRYNVSDSRHTWYNHGRYLYSENNVKEDMNAIWSDAYIAILNLNAFVENLEGYSVLPVAKENILKGEALGLRAMLHFDLLRLFGPVYSADPDGLAIPYYTTAKAEANDFLPASEVMEMVLEDLQTAATLLVDDPVITNGKAGEEDINQTFYTHRNLRLNYYAVRALQARVNLYAGNNEAALTAAQEVIDEASIWFPWTEPTAVVSAGDNPDRTFSPEVIFALQNLDLYNQQRDLFASDLDQFDILAPYPAKLGRTFESNENDYRYNPLWILPATGSKTYRTFYKYADVTDKERSYRYMQPLIRITEMYYIAAETATDEDAALDYLNAVRFNRGLVDLPTGTDIAAEVQKEYLKEFYGEGQLFFFYKRKNMARIPNGNSTSATSTIAVGVEQYVVPLPESETKYQ